MNFTFCLLHFFKFYKHFQVCALSSKELAIAQLTLNDGLGKPLTGSNSKSGLSYEDMVNDEFAFDMDSHDVIVFLHMQKTGRTIF